MTDVPPLLYHTCSLPDGFRDLLDKAQFVPLLLLRQEVSLLGRGEAALRAEAELIERDVLRRLVDAGDNILLLFERARF